MNTAIPILTCLLFTHTAISQTIEEIVERAENALRGSTSHGTFEMTVTTPDFTRAMVMESWWIDRKDDQEDKSLIVILSPKKEEGNKWLKIGNEMWNYLKATETTIKIPPSMMLQSWNGSDFSNDDLARESSMSKDYTAILIGDEMIGRDSTWKIALTPMPEAAVVWGKLYLWIRKNDVLPAVVQYFDEKGALVRYMLYSDYRQMGGRTIPSTWTMHNEVKKGNSTVFKIRSIEFDTQIPSRIFSLRELQRGN